jgi:ubiquinone/menaquinone biosynthesis C-methylase UbiE
VCAIAGIGPGADVLEVGCGTGQLTRQLAGRSLELTAIDIGPAMTAAARRTVADPMARSRCARSSSSPVTGRST